MSPRREKKSRDDANAPLISLPYLDLKIFFWDIRTALGLAPTTSSAV